MGAFDQGRIERDDIEEAAEAEFLFQQKLGDLRFGEGDGGVDEEFAGGVAGRTEVDAVGATLERDRGNGEPLSSGGVPFE